jgi:hypothetical protein
MQLQLQRDTAPELPSALDFDSEWHRAAQEDGRSQRISRNVVRTIYAPPYGSGMTDTVRLGPDALVYVINCVVPRAAHWTYADLEPLITLRASRACDVEFRYGAGPALVFNRPELTLTCIPPLLPLSAHIAAGARHVPHGVTSTQGPQMDPPLALRVRRPEISRPEKRVHRPEHRAIGFRFWQRLSHHCGCRWGLRSGHCITIPCTQA